MNESIQIFGYHGTSRANAIRILNDGFRVSSNDYDWLGEGVYFFQHAPLRASQWAKEQYPEDPVVIRALIRLENLIDLFDIAILFDLLLDQYICSCLKLLMNND